MFFPKIHRPSATRFSFAGMQRFLTFFLLALGAASLYAQSVTLIPQRRLDRPDHRHFDLKRPVDTVVITEYYTRTIADSLRPAGVRRTITLTFDRHGNLKTAAKKSPRHPVQYRYQYTYGPHGPVSLIIAASNGIPRTYRDYHYDPAGHLIKVIVKDRFKRPREIHTYRWDQQKIIRESILFTEDSAIEETEYQYRGHLLTEEITRFHPDSPAAVRIHYTYDASGRRRRSKTLRQDGPPILRRYFYDKRGRLVRTEEAEGNRKATIYYHYSGTGPHWTRMVRSGSRPLIIRRKFSENND